MTLESKRASGVQELVIGGERYETTGNGSYNVGGEERETIQGDNGPVGYKSMARTPFIEVDIYVSGDTDVAAILGARDVTAMLTLKNGKPVVIRDAYYVGDGTVNASEGTMTVRFEGASGEEANF